MSTTRRKVLFTDDVAYLLRRKLGRAQSWTHTLQDMRRDKVTFYGLKLMPVARFYDGRQYAPVYLASDVAAFIKQAIERMPETKPDEPVSLIEIDIDLCDGLPWRVKRYKPVPTTKKAA